MAYGFAFALHHFWLSAEYTAVEILPMSALAALKLLVKRLLARPLDHRAEQDVGAGRIRHLLTGREVQRAGWLCSVEREQNG